MAERGRIDLRLATRVLLVELIVVVLTLILALGLFAWFNHDRLQLDYGNRALDIARVVASAPAVRADVTRYDAAPLFESPALTRELADGQLQLIATQVRQRTDVLFVVITNNQGVRLTHPNVDQLGRHVSNDPAEALAGHEQVADQSGTLGQSVAAKVPVLAPDSDRVVGEVSVGISTKDVKAQFERNLQVLAALGGVSLLMGLISVTAVARRWNRLTLGLRPAEMAEMVRSQTAVLHGIGEGVLAADSAGRVTFVNDEACRLLEIGNETGRPIDEIGLTARVFNIFKAAASVPKLATVGDHIVVVSARPVTRDGRELGTVLVARDRTDVESLTRQLDAVQVMSSVLRAQRHEFANRLHLLNGLVNAGHVEEASQYLEELLGSGPLGSALPGIDAIRDAYLQAFFAAKAAAAREAGVTLRIGENTWVAGHLALPVDVTTVMGNLLDNAIDAARAGGDATKIVEAELVQEGSTLHITVADSGTGVAPDFVAHLFTEGTSTKPDSGIPGGRGIGLALSRQISRSLGGDLRLSSAGNPGAELCGAEFIARLPGVMAEEEQWAEQT